MPDIFKEAHFASIEDSVKIPDIEFKAPVVPFSKSADGSESDNPDEEGEKLSYPTREELAQYYRDEINAILKEDEEKAYSDAIAQKKSELQSCIDRVDEKLEEMQKLQQDYLEKYEKELKFFAIDIAEKMVKQKISEDDMFLKKMVTETISNLKNASWLKVEISEDLVNLVDAIKDELAKPEYHGTAEVSPIACPGDTCRVSTEYGATVATISVQADNLRNAFKDAQSQI